MDSIETPGGLHRFAPSKLLWVGAVAVAVLSAAYAFKPTTVQVDTQGIVPATVPLATGPNRIDHSQIDWEGRSAEPDATPLSVAAYGSGA